jgi:hypothetical protein
VRLNRIGAEAGLRSFEAERTAFAEDYIRGWADGIRSQFVQGDVVIDQGLENQIRAASVRLNHISAETRLTALEAAPSGLKENTIVSCVADIRRQFAAAGPRGSPKTGQSGSPENRPVVDHHPGH